MDAETSRKVMAQALLGDSNVLSAVTSLLRKHNNTHVRDTKETPPMLVLKEDSQSFKADVVFSSTMCPGEEHKSEMSASLEQVHALATASLVASTQRDIAQQLAKQIKKQEKSSVRKRSREPKSYMTYDNSFNEDSSGYITKEPIYKRKYTPTLTPELHNYVKRTEPTRSEPLASKLLVCSFEGCGRKFAWQQHLKYHELTHDNKREHACVVDGCGKSFFTAQGLNVHFRTHTGDKPFICGDPGCGKRFSTAGNLKNHQRLHSGEKPFKCDEPNCQWRFAEHSSLVKHKRTHSRSKPFQCTVCHNQFSQSSSLAKHRVKHELEDQVRMASYSTNSKAEGDDSSTVHVMPTNSPRLTKDVDCPQQVIMLNSYQGVEPMMFSHNLTEHIVTVNGQTLRTSYSQNVFETHNLQDLSEAGNTARNLVYTTDNLDHGEVTGADYTSELTQHSAEMIHPSHVQFTPQDITGCGSDSKTFYATEIALDKHMHSSSLLNLNNASVVTSNCLDLSSSKLVTSESLNLYEGKIVTSDCFNTSHDKVLNSDCYPLGDSKVVNSDCLQLDESKIIASDCLEIHEIELAGVEEVTIASGYNFAPSLSSSKDVELQIDNVPYQYVKMEVNLTEEDVDNSCDQ